jgi:hypothetical protein
MLRNEEAKVAPSYTTRCFISQDLCCFIVLNVFGDQRASKQMSKQVLLLGDYIETAVSKQEEIEIKLNETYVISRVFLYPRTQHRTQNSKHLHSGITFVNSTL